MPAHTVPNGDEGLALIDALGRVYRKHVRNAERLVTRRHAMRMTEFTLLQALATGGPMRLRQIALERFILAEDVFLAAGSMLERGFIRLVRVGDHFGPVEITPTGNRVQARLSPGLQARIAALTGTVARAERTRLINLMARLEAALDAEAVALGAAALELEQLAELMDGDIAA
jgi:hypothetical protein